MIGICYKYKRRKEKLSKFKIQKKIVVFVVLSFYEQGEIGEDILG